MVEIQTLLQGFSVNTSQGSLGYCAVTLLRGQKLTLVDVGHVGRRALLLERLRAEGIAPEAVERIVLTHAHWDHCLNVDCFPTAEVLIHEDELNYTAQPHPLDWATPVWTADVLRRARVTAMREGDELESGVRIMATPGHSPGSQTVLIESPQGTIGLVGDALPNRMAAGWVAPRIVFFDEEIARRCARRILDTCVAIYPGHDRPFSGAGGSFKYLEPTSIDIIFAPRDEDGTVLASIVDDPPVDGPTIMPSARRAAVAGGDNG